MTTPQHGPQGEGLSGAQPHGQPPAQPPGGQGGPQGPPPGWQGGPPQGPPPGGQGGPPQGPPPGWQGGPPQGPPPGWQGGPQQPGGPGQGGGINKKVVAAVIFVLLLIVGGIIAAVLLGGDDDDDSTNADGGDPVAVVETVIDALEEGDCDAAREHAPQLDDTTCEQLKPNGFSYGDVTEGEVNDDEATVHVAIETPDYPEPLDVEVSLTQDGDDWQVVDWSEPAPAEGESDEGESTCAPGSTGSDCSSLVTPEPNASTPAPTDTGTAGEPDTSSFYGTPEELDQIIASAEAFVEFAQWRDCGKFREATDLTKADCKDILEDEIPPDAIYGEMTSVIGDTTTANVVYPATVASWPDTVSLTLTVAMSQKEPGKTVVLGWVYDQRE